MAETKYNRKKQLHEITKEIEYFENIDITQHAENLNELQEIYEYLQECPSNNRPEIADKYADRLRNIEELQACFENYDQLRSDAVDAAIELEGILKDNDF